MSRFSTNRGTEASVPTSAPLDNVRVESKNLSTLTASSFKSINGSSFIVSGGTMSSITIPVNVEKESRQLANLIANRGEVRRTST